MSRSTSGTPFQPVALWRSLLNELRHLNSARLDKNALARLSRRERTSAVKAALTKHHSCSTRCC